jgi:hypothetical protein
MQGHDKYSGNKVSRNLSLVVAQVLHPVRRAASKSFTQTGCHHKEFSWFSSVSAVILGYYLEMMARHRPLPSTPFGNDLLVFEDNIGLS